MIAEDDPDILFIMDLILEEAGYNVEYSSEGKKLIAGDYSLPDLFILDKRIPDIDGMEICRHLRSQDATRDIPIIMISASPGFAENAKKVGVSDFLEKPFRTDDLLNIVRRYT